MEPLHKRRIARGFGVSTKEVTVAQFRRCLDALKIKTDEPFPSSVRRYSPDDDAPIVCVLWSWAAVYCNWLSQQDGIPESEWCYLLKEGGVESVPDYLQRRGYRLPTEAEWEYACRANATTSRFFGTSAALVPKYAWVVESNLLERTWPVGQLKPNDLGLFDIYGNAAEWCIDLQARYPEWKDGAAHEDAEQPFLKVTNEVERSLRGGATG
jgi:formylglycine-generating enzyme required for sulfatase activity